MESRRWNLGDGISEMHRLKVFEAEERGGGERTQSAHQATDTRGRAVLPAERRVHLWEKRPPS